MNASWVDMRVGDFFRRDESWGQQAIESGCEKAEEPRNHQRGADVVVARRTLNDHDSANQSPQ